MTRWMPAVGAPWPSSDLEHVLGDALRALASQMTEHLTGRPTRSGRFRSVAKRPDAHAACERTASALWPALLGVRHFGAVGQLSVDEVSSPQQAVLDREILRHVERIVRGIDFAAGPADPLELIAEGVREGSYVGVPDTVERFRDFCCFPEIFRHRNLGRWISEGRPSVLTEAWARAKEEIARSTHQLTEQQGAQIATICQKAAEYVRNRK